MDQKRIQWNEELTNVTKKEKKQRREIALIEDELDELEELENNLDDKKQAKSNTKGGKSLQDKKEDQIQQSYNLESTLREHAARIQQAEETRQQDLDKNINNATAWLFQNKDKKIKQSVNLEKGCWAKFTERLEK